MAITICGLPLRAHPYLSATLLPWISQTCKANQTRIILSAGIFFILILSLYTYLNPPSLLSRAPPIKDTSLWRSRKSIDSLNYDMRSNSQQMLDYSDPILVDAPVESTGPSFSNKKSPQLTTDNDDLSYGVVIDCGSSGSRAFLYSWRRHSGNINDLLQIRQVARDDKPVVMKITPGISTYASTPSRVGTYLRPLINFIKEEIPYHKQKDTQLYVLCTAGMRMLTKKNQELIVDRIVTTFERSTNFQFSSSHVEVISGLTEGLYFWLAVNYMYGNLQQHHHSLQRYVHRRLPTFGVLDMGGGSLQVAYEVDEEVQDLYPKQVLRIDVGCSENNHDHAYNVFVDTFLHKGGNAVREMYEADLISNFVKSSVNFSISTNNSYSILDPCLSNGFLQSVKSQNVHNDKFTVILNGTGEFSLCKQRLMPYLEKSHCKLSADHSCILSSKPAPSIIFDETKFIGMSEFFYCMDDILEIGGTYDKALYESKASEYCRTPWNITWHRFNDGVYNAGVNRMKFQCFKSAWVSTVLHQGLNFPDHYQGMTSVQHINGSEVHWSWGAMLYKTRFLPLLEIQRHEKGVQEHKASKMGYYPIAFLAHSGIYLFICITIALLYLLISLVKFCVHSRGIKRHTLKRVGASFAQLVHEDV